MKNDNACPQCGETMARRLNGLAAKDSGFWDKVSFTYKRICPICKSAVCMVEGCENESEKIKQHSVPFKVRQNSEMIYLGNDILLCNEHFNHLRNVDAQSRKMSNLGCVCVIIAIISAVVGLMYDKERLYALAVFVGILSVPFWIKASQIQKADGLSKKKEYSVAFLSDEQGIQDPSFF